MRTEHTIVVGIEDLGTAGAVAAEAVKVAIAGAATRLVLVHVLDEHTVLAGLLNASGGFAPLKETADEAMHMLKVAERVIHAQFHALAQPMPTIERVVEHGHVGDALTRVARECAAEWLVLGARRPHLFGRITHPDVVSNLDSQGTWRVHVAPLHEAGPVHGS